MTARMHVTVSNLYARNAAPAPAEEDTDAGAQGGAEQLDAENSIVTERIGMTQEPSTTFYFTPPAEQHHPSSLAFYRVLQDAAALHAKKQRDYGSDADPFANVRASEDFGIPGWLGCIIRGNDKVRRIQSFAKRGELANESLEDALIDLLVYAGIALVLYREETK